MTEKISGYSMQTNEVYGILKEAGVTNDKDLKTIDKNNDMTISEDELVELTLTDDEEENKTSNNSSSTQSSTDDMLIALYEQLDNLMNQRNQINNKMGTAPDLETFNQYKQQSDNIQNQITNLRGQILNAYTNAKSAATAGTSMSGGSYTYSGNSEEFVNTFNNSSFNKGVLAGKGEMVAAIAEEYGLDPNLLASIMALETGWGTSSAIKNYNNPGGMMDPSSNWMSLKHYSSLEEGIRAVAKNLKENYIDQGLTTISSIGAKYCPVGAANDPNGTNSGWVPSVTSIYNQLTGANITSTTQLM